MQGLQGDILLMEGFVPWSNCNLSCLKRLGERKGKRGGEGKFIPGYQAEAHKLNGPELEPNMEEAKWRSTDVFIIYLLNFFAAYLAVRIGGSAS